MFGWIDGIRRKLDDNRTIQLISPRKAQHWTKTYKDRYAKLKQLGLVTQAGKDSVTLSKSNGLWNYMDDADALIKPQDFIEALLKLPQALNNFDNFNPSSKRFMLRYIKISKTDVTRQKRINDIAILAQDNKKLPGS